MLLTPEDKALDRMFNSKEPLPQACAGVITGANLIEPFEPEMTKDIRARFHSFADQISKITRKRDREGMLRNLTELRDSLLVIAAIANHHKIDDVGITNNQLVDGFLGLADNLENWALPFGMKPTKEKRN